MSQVSVTVRSEGSEWLSSPGQNQHLALCLPALLPTQMWRLGCLALTLPLKTFPGTLALGVAPGQLTGGWRGGEDEGEHCGGGTCGLFRSPLCRCCDRVLGYRRTASSHSRPGVNRRCPCWYLVSAQSHVLPYKLWKCLGVDRCHWPERLRLTSDKTSFFPAVPHHLLTCSAPSVSLKSFKEEASEGPHGWEQLIRWEIAPVGVCGFP